MKKIVLLFSLVSCSIFAQNQLGLHTSFNSGATSFTYNPAMFHSSSLNYDFVLLSGGAFIHNEYAFIHQSSVRDLLFNDITLLQFNEGVDLNTSNFRYYDFFDQRKMDQSVNAFVGLPSFAFRLNRNISLGFFGKLRQAFSANNVDEDLSLPSIESWNLGDVHKIDPLNTTGLLWSEIGLNIGFSVPRVDRNISFGANLKFLSSHQAFYISSLNTINLISLQDSMNVENANVMTGFTDPSKAKIKPLGHGVGADLGIVYDFSLEDRNISSLKLGLSISDLGFVRVNANAETHQFSANSTTIVDSSFNNINNLQDFMNTLSNEVYNDQFESYTGKQFTVYTPAYFSASLDLGFSEKLFANLNINRRLMINPIQPEKENFTSVSVRYENDFIELGLPVVLYENRDPRFGFWFRLGWITIGSDHIGSLVFKERYFQGSDFYFAIRFNDSMFKKGTNSKKRNPDRCFY